MSDIEPTEGADDFDISPTDDLTPEERAKLVGSVNTYAARLNQPATPIDPSFMSGSSSPVMASSSTKKVATAEEARAFFGDPPDPDRSDVPNNGNNPSKPKRALNAEETVKFLEAKRLIREELKATPATLPPTPSGPPKPVVEVSAVAFDQNRFGGFPPLILPGRQGPKMSTLSGSVGIHLQDPVWSSPESPFMTAATRLEATGDPAFAGLVAATKSVLAEHPTLKPNDPEANQLIGERLHQRRVIEDVARQLQTTPTALTAEEFIDVVEAEKVRFPLIAVELPNFARFRGSADFRLWFEEWKIELGFTVSFRPPPPITIEIPVDGAFFDRWRARLDELKPDSKQPRAIWGIVRGAANMVATLLDVTETSVELFVDLVKEIQTQRKQAKE